MIQRIQSVFLAISAIASLTSVFLVYWREAGGTELAELSAIKASYFKDNQLVSSFTTFYLAVLCGISAGLSVLSIMSYKNRLTQMKINMLNSLVLTVCLFTVVYLGLYKVGEYFNPADAGSPATGMYFLVTAIFMIPLANRFIRKDEQLVRSVDRLR